MSIRCCLLFQIALPTLFLCGPACAKRADFSGLHFGLGLGGTQAVSHSEGTSTADVGGNLIINRTFEGKGSATGLEGDLIAGYGQVVNQKYLVGLEGIIGFHRFKINSRDSVASVGGGTTNLDTKTTLKTSSPFVGLLLKPGFFISPQTLFYGLVGAKIAGFKVTAESNHSQFIGIDIISAASGDKNVIRAGLALGLGMERYVTDKVTLGLNYQYVYYGHSDLTTSASFDGVNGALSVMSRNKPYINALLIKFNYYV